MGKEARFLLVLTLLFVVGFVSADSITEDLHLTIQVTNSSGSVLTGTYAFVFNVSNSSNCSDMASILYTNSTTIDTDTRGIINMYLPNVTLDYDIQYWLCYFRNSTLQDTVKIARVPYVFDAKNISAQGIKNDSNIVLTNFNISSSYITATSNVSASWFLGIANQSDTLDGYNSTFFLPLNTSVFGTFNFNGGWESSGLTISGGNLFAQTIFVYNITSLNITSLNINGSLTPHATFDNFFDLGNSTSRFRDLSLGRNAYINGSLAVDGNVVLGNANTDNITANAYLNSHLIPYDNARDLGSSANRWRVAYVDNLNANSIAAGEVNISGTNFDTFTIHTNNTGDDLLNASLVFERGTPIINAVILWDSSADRFNFNFPIFSDTVYSSAGNLSVSLQYLANGSLAKTDSANSFGAFNQTFNAGGLFFNANSNRTGINTTVPNSTLHILGSLNVTGNVSIGGNLTFEQADYAELFASDVDLERGDVVCLDAEKKISKCQKRADNSVVGAVSMNPSIIGRNLGFKQAYAVGLVGVVPVKVIGPVERFNLLTSSNVPGYAEKATISDFGAIIGKSMESCNEDKCVVDVLAGLK